MITLHTHTEASDKAMQAAIRRTRRFAEAAASFAEEMPDSAEGAEAAAIADALLADNGRRVAGIATRHLPSMSARVRRIAEEMQGAEMPDALCPLLAAEGITPTEAQAARVRNGREHGAEMRATTYRCPVCLAADVVRTLRRDGAEARDADARWNRRGA